MGLQILLCFVLFSCFSSTAAYDALDPRGNITITWDVLQWTDDGYVASVTISNFQQYRHIQSPGWALGWTWPKNEVIWNIRGGEATQQGDCSNFRGPNIPHSCKKTPEVVDLLPGVPINVQAPNCCRGGVLSALGQDPATSSSSFVLTVGSAGASRETVEIPKDFNLKAPGPGYACTAPREVVPSQFLKADRRRTTQAMMTWSLMCSYSQYVAHKLPTCCVSLSAFYSTDIVRCPDCACGCRSNLSCLDPNSVESVISERDLSPLVQCTSFMCPIRVHWHVKLNYKGYWRVKIAVTNFNHQTNYSDWNLVVQHPNMNNLTEVFSFNYRPLSPRPTINDTAMFWGRKSYNDLLIQAGPLGNVQSELLFGKGASFTFGDGWAFPRRVSFNGDTCIMPGPEAYPHLPRKGSPGSVLTTLLIIVVVCSVPVYLFYSFRDVI